MVTWLVGIAFAQEELILRPSKNLVYGDFDLDGLLDYAVGEAGGGTSSSCTAGTGRVSVHYGDDLQTSLLLAGAAACGAARGYALAAGDVNGDGYDVLTVGGPGAELLQVHHGGAAGLGAVSATFRKSSTDGTNPDYGAALASGDFDCNGVDDVAVGLPAASVRGFAGAGTVAVLNGSSAGLTNSNTRLSSETYGLDTAAAGDSFGIQLASARVFGCTPLAIALPGRDVSGQRDAGAVHVLFGSAQGVGAQQRTRLTETEAGRTPTAGRFFGGGMVALFDTAATPTLLIPVEDGLVVPFGSFVNNLPPVASPPPPCYPCTGTNEERVCCDFRKKPPGPSGPDCVDCCVPGP